MFGIAGIAHRASWPTVVAGLLLAAACGYGLRRRETDHAAPILAIDLFRIPLFALSSATSICAFAIQGLIFVVLPFLFQFKFGYSQIESGYLITPWPVTLAIMTLIAAPLGDRVQPGLLGGGGLFLVGIGIASLSFLSASPSPFEIAWRLILCGIGFGFFQTPNMNAIMSSAPTNRSGGASGILAASRLFGQSVGAAIVAICLSFSPENGIWTAIWVGAALGMLGSAVSLLRLLPIVQART
jgi:DHA2 family multidrug resistance protein-like MFS transporter